jgi:hypothetical protein
MSLSFVSSTLGWALGSNGNLYGTEDGGIHWTLQLATAATAATSSGAIDFVDASSGWLASGRELYETSDGARSWSLVQLPAIGPSKSLPARLGSPRFFSSDNGILPATLSNGKSVVYITSDAGRSWSYRSAPIAMGENPPGWWTMPSFSASSPSEPRIGWRLRVFGRRELGSRRLSARAGTTRGSLNTSQMSPARMWSRRPTDEHLPCQVAWRVNDNR